MLNIYLYKQSKQSKSKVSMTIILHFYLYVQPCVHDVPDRDSTVSVDVFHRFNVCVQLRVTVQISCTASL